MICQAMLLLSIILLGAGGNSAPLSTSTCHSCGNITIPFPFGTSSVCSLDNSFLITCNHSYDPPKPFLDPGITEVLDISLDGLMRVASSVAADCYNESGALIRRTVSEFSLSRFPISSAQNKFTTVGCDTYALMEGSDGWKQMSAGCISQCDNDASLVNGTCLGVGCCQTMIPKSVKYFLLDTQSFRNHSMVHSFNPCGYAFVVESEAFEFSSSDLVGLQSRNTVPVVLDWSVGNVTCQQALRNISTFACRARHSECIDSSYEQGYLCKCLTGYKGNPYLDDGCHDIDECTPINPCNGTCKNLQGSYSCSCPKGFEGDGKKDGSGCHPKSRMNGSALFHIASRKLFGQENIRCDGSGCHPKSRMNGYILFYIASGLTFPVVVVSWLFVRHKPKRVIAMRQQAFQRNGGLLLEHMLSGRQRTLKIFTAEDLKQATDNYSERSIYRSRLPYGDCSYSGILPDGGHGAVQIEAIKTCQLPADESESFIRKLVLLAQIKHPNVVKLLGCCLETAEPVVVYEYISAKTLYDYIREEDYLSWDVRLKIAAEAAEAFAHLHSSVPEPIIHGNINSSGIFVQFNQSVKVHDFRLTLSQSHSFFYRDPEYILSDKPTAESDVYGFGEVLGELLTGMEVIGDNLAQKFVTANGEDELIGMVDRHLENNGGNNTEQMKEVAKLARKCLSQSSIYRPTMKNVSVALQDIICRNSSSTAVCQNSNRNTIAPESGRLSMNSGSTAPVKKSAVKRMVNILRALFGSTVVCQNSSQITVATKYHTTDSATSARVFSPRFRGPLARRSRRHG